MTSPAQITANRENAARSTGPRTQAGKNKSNMNALRHGLTGRIVVLPTEEMAEFKRFSQLMLESLAPADTIEQELAQTIADSQWRINRILSIEDGMLALGNFENSNEFDTEDPAINSALAQSRAFRDHSHSFVNLSIYEQRIHRTMEKAHKRLQELQTARKTGQSAATDEPIPLPQVLKPNDLSQVSKANASATGQSYPRNGVDPNTPMVDGFVNASEVIALEADLEHRRKLAIRAGLYVPTIDEINDCIDRYGLPELQPIEKAA